MTLKQLKEKCREKGLKVSGNKQELTDRLLSPKSPDFTNQKASTVRVGLGWGDSNAKKMSHLVEKGFAKFTCYATDNFIYEVNKDKWAQILSQQS
jgi:hypothetical protein